MKLLPSSFSDTKLQYKMKRRFGMVRANLFLFFFYLLFSAVLHWGFDVHNWWLFLFLAALQLEAAISGSLVKEYLRRRTEKDSDLDVQALLVPDNIFPFEGPTKSMYLGVALAAILLLGMLVVVNWL
jgi:hypothetical protein